MMHGPHVRVFHQGRLRIFSTKYATLMGRVPILSTSLSIIPLISEMSSHLNSAMEEREVDEVTIHDGSSSADSFETFFTFVSDQLKELPPKLQAKAKREIVLVAEDTYGKILADEKAARQEHQQ
ncbi:hypothetical protein QR680_016956 [Steinernema hermaphroditum]|uniref:Uncharacterized protein n=1 Tax=Steinernema hermaphroditum TaxID=289476 RepID=A0AA39HDA8_9BILA|nr:hypothetical protein QR680_016956 [Steinernema hermaphroditum]